MNTISYTYDDADRLVTIARPNLVTSTYGYDAAGQLLSLSHAGSGGTLSSFDYTYDGVGNRVAVTETFTSTVAIDYTYDPLYRLTAVEYSDLSYFHYAYDAVGNRLSYEVTGGETITYTYDIANHLTSVDGVTYTWDNNGNLLDDGLNTYAYDQANRLTSVMSMPPAVTFAYRCNGLSSDPWGIIGCESDRVSQTVNGVTTDFVLDLAAGLTQVLSYGTNTYLYGNGRIAQHTGMGSEYFLTDGLGSVRQLVDDTASITLSKSYRPYGEILISAGSGSSSYGFTGEMTDLTGLIYLRARYMDPRVGRFLAKDVWQGDYYRPLSLNGWNYVEGNPINFLDPSGHWRWWLANPLYHMPIENWYEHGPTNILFGNHIKQLEYPIPGTPFRHPDMFNSHLGDVYEIEPIFLIANGSRQVIGYVRDLNAAANAGLLEGKYASIWPYNWNNTSFHVGTGVDWPGKFRKSPLSIAFPFVDLVADYVGSGVVAYWLEPNALAPILVGKPLTGIVPNKRLLRPRNWIPTQPAFQPAYAIDFNLACGAVLIATGTTIIVVTIVEDATIIGLVDDIISIPGGFLLINYGLKIAAYSPVP